VLPTASKSRSQTEWAAAASWAGVAGVMPVWVNHGPVTTVSPSASVSTTSPLPAPVGTMKVTEVLDQAVTVVGTPPRVTLPCVVPRPWPVSVTLSPVAPLAGRSVAAAGVRFSTVPSWATAWAKVWVASVAFGT